MSIVLQSILGNELLVLHVNIMVEGRWSGIGAGWFFYNDIPLGTLLGWVQVQLGTKKVCEIVFLNYFPPDYQLFGFNLWHLVLIWLEDFG